MLEARDRFVRKPPHQYNLFGRHALARGYAKQEKVVWGCCGQAHLIHDKKKIAVTHCCQLVQLNRSHVSAKTLHRQYFKPYFRESTHVTLAVAHKRQLLSPPPSFFNIGA